MTPRIDIFILFMLCGLSASPAGAETALLSIRGLEIRQNEYAVSFTIETWDVELLAICRIPPAWEIGGGRSIDASGTLFGSAGGAVAAVVHGQTNGLDGLFLISLPKEVRSADAQEGVTVYPATLKGRYGVETYGSDMDPVKRTMSWANFTLVPASRCPDPKIIFHANQP